MPVKSHLINKIKKGTVIHVVFIYPSIVILILSICKTLTATLNVTRVILKSSYDAKCSLRHLNIVM